MAGGGTAVACHTTNVSERVATGNMEDTAVNGKEQTNRFWYRDEGEREFVCACVCRVREEEGGARQSLEQYT